MRRQGSEAPAGLIGRRVVFESSELLPLQLFALVHQLLYEAVTHAPILDIVADIRQGEERDGDFRRSS